MGQGSQRGNMMAANSDKGVGRTDRLDIGDIRDLSVVEPQLHYKPMPHPQPLVVDGVAAPVWRVRFELASNTSIAFGIDLNGEVILGRDSAPDVVDLRSFSADDLGVSRRHALLAPTTTKLYIMDLGSTNGTLRNGQPIGFKIPYDLLNGDTITLGKLEFVVRIVERPKLPTPTGDQQVELADAVLQIAKVITSQLELDVVLKQVASVAMALTAAGEAGVWLVDEQTGNLQLQAHQGIDDPKIQQMRLSVTGSLAGKVIETGKPLRATSQEEGQKIKVKTGYLVGALLYVPISLGGSTFGVLAVAHREANKAFTARDEKLLQIIAEFAAIGVQNSRLYHATDRALAQRVEELAALNQLSRAVSSSLDLGNVHDVLVEQLKRRWDVEAVRLWPVDQERQRLILYRGTKPGVPWPTFERNRGLIGIAAESGEAVFSNDVPNDPRHDPGLAGATGLIVQSMMAVPLKVQDQVVGVLVLYNRRNGIFNEDDIHRLESFANPVATAIQNARLFADSERERAIVRATMGILGQPLLILDEQGNIIVANRAAEEVLTHHMSAVFEGISEGVGKTSEIRVGDETYITTAEHAPEVGTIVVMQDMTYVKRLEQTRAEFVSALSHDLKGPLTSIKGWVTLVQQTGPLNDLAAKFLGRITMSADTILRMINQLLDIVLLSDSPLQTSGPTNLAEQAKRAVEDLEGAAMVRGINLAVDMQGEPYLIRGDANRLYRSILNLIENALKYSPDGTTVQVALSFDPDAVFVTVRDHGPGIASSDLPYIFERYFRGEAALSNQPGIGLGLALVQAAAKAHGGTVSARNAEGGGAELTITLPATLRVAT